MKKNGKWKKVFMVVVVCLSVASSVCVQAASTFGFPYHAKYPYGNFQSLADSQGTAESLLRSEWESYKRERITSNGAKGFKRVQRDGSDNYDTVSEGLGYGMLLSVYFQEQELFDQLYNYVKCFLNTNGLMSWHIDSSGNIMGKDSIGAATDADEDIALALVFAHKKWGSTGTINYETEAKRYISNIYNKMVEQGTYVLKPGDMWGGSDCTNPSYYSPAWYRIFADFTGNSGWIKVADKCYEIAENAQRYNNNTGLVPDWCKADGTRASGQGYDFKYDAIRYQWRVAIDYSWFGTPKAKEHCEKINTFFKNIGYSNIKDGYTITGSQISANHSSTFIACCAASAMVGEDSSYAKNIYNENVKIKDIGNYSYYGNSLRLMALLYNTGNFPNLYSNESQQEELLMGDVNKDGAVDALDYATLKKAVLAQSFTSIDKEVADINKDGTIDVLDLALFRKQLLS